MIETPGAVGSVCYAYVDGLRYRVHPPEIISVDNTKENMVVDCLAPGNRRKKIEVEPHMPPSFYANVANGLAGAPWDAASGAWFKYPDVVEVDFTEIAIRPEEMPLHNAPDIRPPEDYMLEEFSASEPRLNSDRYESVYQIQRRESAVQTQVDSYVDESFTFDDPMMPSPTKSDLSMPSSIDMNPALPVQDSVSSNPPIDVQPVYGPSPNAPVNLLE